MSKFKACIAVSRRQLRANLRLRWVVFGKEMGYLPTADRPVSMEFDDHDRLDTTLLFIVLEKEGAR